MLAYAAKYASPLYGPFRQAVDVAIADGGDRAGYQQDGRNRREALDEVALDIAEGADLVMVKPALPFLDVVAAVRSAVTVPVAAYHVSGEYAMVCAAAERGWIDGAAVALEQVEAIKRAGADVVLTYFAGQLAEVLGALTGRGRTGCSNGPPGSSPGGSNSPVRSFRSVGGHPVFVDRGEGAYVWDVDGNRMIDFVQSYGASLLGHAHPAVVEAVRRAAGRGTTFGAPTEGEVLLAEAICDRVDGCEQVRLVSSGTEAAMSAVRVARGFTGRSRIVKFAGCYHGHSDGLLAGGGSGVATLGLPDSAGVPLGAVADTVVAPYNVVPDLDDGVACVIVEPVAANMGLVPPVPGFLAGLRAACDAAGALLIFDEVITGFRLGEGGASAWSGVRPDLWCFGKVIGGGLPVGAFGGRREVLAMLAPEGPVYQAGTLSGNPLATAAGLAVLGAVDADLLHRTVGAGGRVRRRACSPPSRRGSRRPCRSRSGSRCSGRCWGSSSRRPGRGRPPTSTAPPGRWPPVSTRPSSGGCSTGGWRWPPGPTRCPSPPWPTPTATSTARWRRPARRWPRRWSGDLAAPARWARRGPTPPARRRGPGRPVRARHHGGRGPDPGPRPGGRGHPRPGAGLGAPRGLVGRDRGVVRAGRGAAPMGARWPPSTSPPRTGPSASSSTPPGSAPPSWPPSRPTCPPGRRTRRPRPPRRWSAPPPPAPVGLPTFMPPPPGYGPPPAVYPAPYPPGPPTAGPWPPGAYPSPAWGPQPVKPARARRRTLLVSGAVLVVAGIGLALVLGVHHGRSPGHAAVAQPVSPDQHLADQLMLTTGDLPTGWTVAGRSGGGVAATPSGRAAQQQIEQTFVQCMGITPDQAATVLGGQASDQTAASSSPVFIGPSTGTSTPSGEELQTAAAIVRTHSDEQHDFALFTSPKFPQCNGAVTAAELQLGINGATGTTVPAGPVTATVVNLTAPAGEQVFGVTMSFDATDGTTTVPVVVDQLVVGSDRAEGQLVAFGLGGPFSGDVLSSTVATFEHRLADQGGGASA